MNAIYLIRHGQASFGKSNYDKLSDLGRKQAEVLGKSFVKRSKIDRVFRGDMLRHEETADLFLKGAKLKLSPKVDKRWNEFDHKEIIQVYNPRYKYKWYMVAHLARKFNPKREFKEMFNKALTQWISGSYDDKYSETFKEFNSRSIKALNKVADNLKEDENAAVFTSGGVIGCIIQDFLKTPAETALKNNWLLVNGGVTKILKTKRGLILSSINEHSAFESNKDLISYI